MVLVKTKSLRLPSFFCISNNNTHSPAILLILQPYLPSPIQSFGILHYIAFDLLHTVSCLDHLNKANPVDMSLVGKPRERSTLSSSKETTVPPSSIIHTKFGIGGYMKGNKEFDRTLFARTGNMVVHTDLFDDQNDNELIISPCLTGVSSLDSPDIFVPEESVSFKFDGVTMVTTYETPAATVVWIKVIPDNSNPYPSEELVDSLVPPEFASACFGWYPAEVQICVEDPPRSSHAQESTAIQDARVFEGRFC